MDLLGLDENFMPEEYIPYLNLQWNREYYGCGQWTAQIPAERFNKDVKYVFTNERPEVGIVQKIKTQTTAKGRFVMLSGYFLESVLDRNVIDLADYDDDDGDSARVGNIAWAMVHSYAPAGFTIREGTIIAGDKISQKWVLQPLGSALYEMLEEKELSQRIRYRYSDNRLYYDVWQGKDRTSSQNENGRAVFMDTSPYVTDFEITEDESDYCNSVRVGEGEEGHETFRYVDRRNLNGADRRVTAMDKTGSSPNAKETKQNTQEAYELLDAHKKTQDIQIKVMQKYLLYGTDYDLGDKCDIAHTGLGRSYTSRIVAVNEVWKGGLHEITLTFGEKTPTIYKKFARRIKSIK